ncbi:hypothetical protein CFN78_24840 [Amycolatopsis antarctica]|uniref:Uncharacterized protein n=1 Tax=Amycolatopsis antarctica TaxID=1854586 RepID=A0A263CYY6_9PSEU|nr:hypothetical protein [Amycolatopsis antarctica]OZM70627.1 hypothetical protein CFN78_24840 [Amycolatopsis antarctica]
MTGIDSTLGDLAVPRWLVGTAALGAIRYNKPRQPPVAELRGRRPVRERGIRRRSWPRSYRELATSQGELGLGATAIESEKHAMPT